MKKILFLFAIIASLSASSATAQIYAALDASAPMGGPGPNVGGRLMMFSDISSKWQWGITGRAHRFIYDKVATAEGPAGGVVTVNSISIGVGARYYFVNDVNSTYALYLNPNVELASIEGDEGVDLVLGVGYTRALSPLLSLMIEVGVRQRAVLHGSPYATENRFVPYAGGGIGLRIPYFGRGMNNQTKYR